MITLKQFKNLENFYFLLLSNINLRFDENSFTAEIDSAENGDELIVTFPGKVSISVTGAVQSSWTASAFSIFNMED